MIVKGANGIIVTSKDESIPSNRMQIVLFFLQLKVEFTK